LLPTPPRDGAVTVGYRPESVCLEWTFTTLFVYAFRRTSRSLRELRVDALFQRLRLGYALFES
jgi:hypothetical protein